MDKRSIWVLAAVCLLAGCTPRTPPTTTATPSTVPTEVSTILPTTTVTTATEAPSTVPPETPGGLDGDTSLRIYVTEEETIREMPVEEYLCGVLAGEMRGDWPQEALRAQAVVARTFILYFLEEKGGSMYDGADLSTDVAECQAYDAAGVNDAIREAVRATSGETLTYGGRYINAWFHSCSGGKTATAPEGLNYEKENPPYIRVVESPEEDAPEEFSTWEAAFSAEEVEGALEEMGIKAKLTSASIAKRGPSGRCTQLEVGGKTVNCVDLRVALDPTRFRSTQLTGVSLEDGSLILSGKGFGHGVGMAQWGAYTMARQGKTYLDILAYYYEGTEITRAW